MASQIKQFGFVFIFLSMLTGLIGAFVNPLMSLFIIEGLQSPPMFLGIYTTAVTLTGIVCSQWLGHLADKGVSARKLFIVSVFAMALALIVFANAEQFWHALAAGICLLSFGNAAIPQMMTIARQWADQNSNVDITKFNSRLRAAISLAWVAGPPLGYLLASGTRFDYSFYTAATFALIAIMFAVIFIPANKVKTAVQTAHENMQVQPSFWLLGSAITFGSIANIMYSSALPLYAINERGFASHTPGLFMGLVAFVEIPIMLYAASLSKRISKVKLLAFAFSCAFIFYLGIFFADQVWQFLVLQCVNALFYGVFAGIGLTVLQDQLPKRVGFTSAFYGNAIKVGVMLGTSLTGLVAQFYSFRFASLGSALMVVLAILCLLAFYQLQQKEQRTLSKLPSHA